VIDSNYALAWAGLSYAHSAEAGRSYVQVDLGYKKARGEAEKALKLDPNLSLAYGCLGWIKMTYDWDWNGADAEFKQALSVEPGNADLIRGSATLAGVLGRFDEAMILDRRAIELDPIRVGAYFALGVHASYAGRWEEAEAAVRKALEMNPQFPGGHGYIGCLYLLQSKSEAAVTEMQKEIQPIYRLFGLASAYHATGRKSEADGALAEILEKYQEGFAYQIAEIYGYRGESDKAFEWLERAYSQRDGGLSGIKGDPLLHSIEKDPRYATFMKKMKLPL
jgi:tetratricopeptide (TPR) repeat protein